MNYGRENSLHHLTGQCHVSDLGIGVWQELAETYPYFIPAQFFLAAKLKKDSVPAAAAQIVKTGLYFTNPYWLQLQLQELVEEAPVLHTEKRIVTPIPAAESILADAGFITTQPKEVEETIIAGDSPIHAAAIVPPALDNADAKGIEETETTENSPIHAAAIVPPALDNADAKGIEETETTENSPIHAAAIVPPALDNADAKGIEETETTENFPIYAAAIVPPALDNADAKGIEETETTENSPIYAAAIVPPALDNADAKGMEETETTENSPIYAAAIVQRALDAADTEEIVETETTGDISATVDAPVHPNEKSILGNKISGILSGQLAQFKKPLSADEKLEIEKESETRLHTIDYFASQGIKIDLSAIPKDKLTSSMLRFTDWLKQMKNPNAAPANLGTTEEMEKAVIEIAKVSNINREVFTEAMADVLAKQGQLEKAIQLLIKLSFLNPEKSSYFATRIEQLKGIT